MPTQQNKLSNLDIFDTKWRQMDFDITGTVYRKL